MPILPHNIMELVESDKRMTHRPKWDDDSDPRYHVFTVPLILLEEQSSGLELRVKVAKNHIDRDCLMQLEFSSGKRDRIELSRSQWRPFETHTNKAWGPPGHELQRFERKSHFHDFRDNFLISEHRMRTGSLPAARPIEPDPPTLSEFFVFSAVRFKILNVSMIELPHQSADLFWVKHGSDR
jgi:hypothetical protein